MNAQSGNASWAQRSTAAVWHPCSQMKDYEALPPIPIARAQGVWLEDFDGKRYIDGISSWWTNIFGHGHPHIRRAVTNQHETLDHVLMAGFTHEAGVRLAERLIALTPAPLTRCFYADNGSSAVEAALKMSFHYWHNKGQQRPRFISLRGSYHGETLGALAVGDVALYKSTYEPLLMRNIVVEGADAFDRPAGATWAEHAADQIKHMRTALENHAGEVAAVIVEPLVQCAGHMRMYDTEYLRLLRGVCDEFDVHLIFDEIAVGFGRTGTLFTTEQAGVCPDLMCLSKGITGGTMTLATVLATDDIYNAFYDDYTKLNAFLQSHSYTGNPIACAAANATLDLFEQSDVIGNNRMLGQTMEDAVADLREHPNVADIRRSGMILAIELAQTDGTPFDWQQRRGRRAYAAALDAGVLLRPLGEVIYFMPPYVITPDEIGQMADAARAGIAAAVA